MIPSLPRCLVLFVAFLPLLPALTRADSIEKIPVTPEDLARELGIEMDKFEARFDTPVYATLRLLWKQTGAAQAQSMQHSSLEPDQYHEILFVRKDYGEMQRKTGGDNARNVKDVLEMNVRFGSTGFFYRDINPFANKKAGQSFQSWSKQQSREPLPLDQPILLSVMAGPMDPSKPQANLLEDYRTAPAFLSLSVTFSKTPPPPPATAPATAPAAVLQPVSPPTGAPSATPTPAPAPGSSPAAR